MEVLVIRSDWQGEFNQNNLTGARLICPHCQVASTFQTVAASMQQEGARLAFYAVLRCNYAPCRNHIYVRTTKHSDMQQNPTDELIVFPTRGIAKPHPALPPPIAEDWIEAQKAFEAGAVKAAAVMCRRILYGILLDRKCKEHPLQEGLEQLAKQEKLPAIVEKWLVEIKDDGHDAAHPHRALCDPVVPFGHRLKHLCMSQRNLDGYLAFFDRERAHQGCRTQARTPYRAFQDGIEAMRREEVKPEAA